MDCLAYRTRTRTRTVVAGIASAVDVIARPASQKLIAVDDFYDIFGINEPRTRPMKSPSEFFSATVPWTTALWPRYVRTRTQTKVQLHSESVCLRCVPGNRFLANTAKVLFLAKLHWF